MTKNPRERLFLGASGVVLLAALIGAVWMLQRARNIWSDEADARERVALMERRDELRGAVAEITCLRRLTALPSEYGLGADLRDTLQRTARAFQDDPLDGTDKAGTFACIAIELSNGEDGLAVWTSGPMDVDDRTWCLAAISAGGSDQGSRRFTGDTRMLGVAWCAFRVGDDTRVGALAWITPRSR